MKAGRRGGILWVTRDNTAPHPYLVEACRRAGGEVRELRWAEEFEWSAAHGPPRRARQADGVVLVARCTATASCTGTEACGAMTGDNSCYLSMNEDTEPDDGVLAVPLDTERQLRKQGYGPLYWLSPYVRRGASLIPERTPLRMSLRPRHATP